MGRSPSSSPTSRAAPRSGRRRPRRCGRPSPGTTRCSRRPIRTHGGTHIRPRGEGDSRFAVFASARGRRRRRARDPARLRRRALADAAPGQGPDRASTPARPSFATATTTARPSIAAPASEASATAARRSSPRSTAALVRDDLPDGASLLDLGAHRLRDLARPEQVTQLSAADLPAELPAAQLARTPAPTTSRSRRRRSSGAKRRSPASATCSLRTTPARDADRPRRNWQDAPRVAGGGRPGRSVPGRRLLRGPRADHRSVADRRRRSRRSSALPSSGERLLDDLKRFLQPRSLLLVLDNFEQILAGAPVVVGAAGRERRAEDPGDQPGCAPGPGRAAAGNPAAGGAGPRLRRRRTAHSVEALRQYPAVALFVERARAVRADFALTPENSPDVATICARLDGLPLALELAAARVRLLPPAAMVRRLEQSLPLLSGGARDLPARQRTLRDTIAWSYDLLPEPEQRLFRWLSVFVGGFSLEAAAAICNCRFLQRAQRAVPPIDVLEGIDSLIGHSLVQQSRGAGRRAALHDAGDDPRVRPGAAGGERRDRRGFASAIWTGAST